MFWYFQKAPIAKADTEASPANTDFAIKKKSVDIVVDLSVKL